MGCSDATSGRIYRARPPPAPDRASQYACQAPARAHRPAPCRCEPASLGSDIDRRQTLCSALVFGQHEGASRFSAGMTMSLSQWGNQIATMRRPVGAVSRAGRAGTCGGMCGVDCGMIQTPTLTAVSGCGMHGHAFRCRVIGNSIIRNGQGFAPWKNLPACHGRWTLKTAAQTLQAHLPAIMRGCEFASALSPLLRLGPLRHPAPNQWPPDRTTRHAQPAAGGKIGCLLKAHQHHAPNRRTTQRLFRGPHKSGRSAPLI